LGSRELPRKRSSRVKVHHSCGLQLGVMSKSNFIVCACVLVFLQKKHPEEEEVYHILNPSLPELSTYVSVRKKRKQQKIME
jgi:hypothetical protein